MKKNIIKVFYLFAVIFFIGVFMMPPEAPAEALYAITFNNELISIDSSTGAGTLIGNLDSPMAGYGLGDRNGKLYTYDQLVGVIRELDPLTGHTLATIDIGLGSRIGEGAIDFQSNGMGYLAQSLNLLGDMWSFDIIGGTSTNIGLDRSIDGMDFDSSGVMYGLSQYTAALYTINTTTGISTLVGDTGFDSNNHLEGLAFGSTGILYAIIDDNLYSLDKNTGAASLIGSTGFSNVSGLSALSVPEPSTLFLLGSGLVGLVGFGRRKFRK